MDSILSNIYYKKGRLYFNFYDICWYGSLVRHEFYNALDKFDNQIQDDQCGLTQRAVIYQILIDFVCDIQGTARTSFHFPSFGTSSTISVRLKLKW